MNTSSIRSTSSEDANTTSTAATAAPRSRPWPLSRSRRNSESSLHSLQSFKDFVVGSITRRRNSISSVDSKSFSVLRANLSQVAHPVPNDDVDADIIDNKIGQRRPSVLRKKPPPSVVRRMSAPVSPATTSSASVPEAAGPGLPEGMFFRSGSCRNRKTATDVVNANGNLDNDNKNAVENASENASAVANGNANMNGSVKKATAPPKRPKTRALPLGCKAASDAAFPPQSQSNKGIIKGKENKQPPPAFYNRQYRHNFSASPSGAQKWYTLGNNSSNSTENDTPQPLSSNSPRSRTSSASSGGSLGLASQPQPTPAPTPTLTPTTSSPPPTRSVDKPTNTPKTVKTFLRPPKSKLDVIPLAMYPPEKNGSSGIRTQRVSAPVGSRSMDEMPVIHRPTAFTDSPSPIPPPGYNRPRRLSNSSSTSTTCSFVSSAQESVDSRIRSASISSSQTSIDSWPSSPTIGVNGRPVSSPAGWPCGPAGAGSGGPWQRPTLLKSYRRRAQGELFAALPSEVLDMILEQLRRSHLKIGSSSCHTCWMRDCCAIAVSARKFLKHAREALYRDIVLVGQDGPALKKRTKASFGARLVLLRRTLRANPDIAVLVKSLKPPARPAHVGVTEYNDLVASVVMACPNFERLVGYYPTYDHTWQRLFHALSTRSNLRDMYWLLEPQQAQRQPTTRINGQNGHHDQEGMTREQAQWFLSYHLNWKQLTTLVVHCQPGASLSPANLLECTIRSLPSLQNLYLSKLPSSSFNDIHLLSLPPLKKLSINQCPGVTTAGLSSLASRPSMSCLQSLTLIHMDVDSLPVIARIFSYLRSLETFTLVQAFPPQMPPDDFMMLFPYLASPSLRKLHWDIPFLPDTATPADVILARSIGAGGFPALRSLCAPNDPDGLFQSLCAPRERIDYPTDRFRPSTANGTGTGSRSSSPWLGHRRNTSSFSSVNSLSMGPGSSFFSGGTPPASPLWPSTNAPSSPRRPGTASGAPLPSPACAAARDGNISNLQQARLAAQARLEAAQRIPRYFVNVMDENGKVVEKHGVGAFLGTVESKIRYILTPEPETGATDESGGLVCVEDLLGCDTGELMCGMGDGNAKKGVKGEKEKEGNGGKEGCTGKWNAFLGVVTDKKDRERWWHQERVRWRGVVLS
ncbi:uncharacterized protein CTHT_0003650 [Thermochaetoides thermophila DSM 1495]|uniref:Uncharacterized protein n=1 Tax=Chaetomium thermophilum (strain DSM 1495 / CBS 144.50 / IMI 039719) TaxID=759272 RepID=G0RZP0_CHATD|nr:hypothetical protein CTHT_0003650 [Thermochaetoides thermophila DSM 1495]EGS23668.1 hypothetical protein CTHT_0003650 [Thermochaetoides thermophila DSM 1495]